MRSQVKSVRVDQIESSVRDGIDDRSSLVEANLGLVRMVVRRYARNAWQSDDLVSDGTLGLIRAAKNFDPGRAVKFSTYAVRCIECEVFRGMEKSDACGVSTPASVRSARRKVEAASRRFFMAHGRSPNAAELSAIVEIPASEIDQLRAGRESRGSDPELSIGSTGAMPTARESEPARAEAAIGAAEDAERLLSVLQPEERRAVRAHFGMPSEDGDAELPEIETDQARRLVAKAMIKLRNEAAKQSARWEAGPTSSKVA